MSTVKLTKEEKQEIKCTNCAKLPEEGEKYKLCSGCNAIRYCSLECQKAAWPHHKNCCKNIGKRNKLYDRLRLMIDHLQTLTDMPATFGPMCERKGFDLQNGVIIIDLAKNGLDLTKMTPKEYAEKTYQKMTVGEMNAIVINREQFLETVEIAQKTLDDFNRRQPEGAKFFLICFSYNGVEIYRSYPAVETYNCIVQ